MLTNKENATVLTCENYVDSDATSCTHKLGQQVLPKVRQRRSPGMPIPRRTGRTKGEAVLSKVSFGVLNKLNGLEVVLAVDPERHCRHADLTYENPVGVRVQPAE